MYGKIVNPSTGRKVSIYSKTGKQVLRNYVDSIQRGGINCTDPRNRDHGCPCDTDLQCKNNVCEFDQFKRRKVCLTDAQRQLNKGFGKFGKSVAKGANAVARGARQGAMAVAQHAKKGAKAVAKGLNVAGKAIAGNCPEQYPKRWRGMNCDEEDDCCAGMACQYECPSGYQMAPPGHKYAGKIVCNDVFTLGPSNDLAWKKCSQIRGYPILQTRKDLEKKAREADAWARQAAKDTAAWANQAGKDINAWGNQAANDVSAWATQAGKDINAAGAKFAQDVNRAGKDIDRWSKRASQDLQRGVSDLGASITGVCNIGNPGQYLNRGDNCGPGVNKKCCPNTVCQDNCPFGSVNGRCKTSPNDRRGGPEKAWKRCSMIKGNLGKGNSIRAAPRAPKTAPRRRSAPRAPPRAPRRGRRGMRGGAKVTGQKCNYDFECASNKCNDPDPTCWPNPNLASDGHFYCMMGPRSQTGHPRQRAEKICLN